jgi:tryptophan-rich sensory protein
MAGAFSQPLLLFYVQLACNAAWPFLFFKGHLIGAALADIAVLFLLVGWTTVAFGRRDVWAGLLFVPYLAWVGFATALNGAIWQLNGMPGI